MAKQFHYLDLAIEQELIDRIVQDLQTRKLVDANTYADNILASILKLATDNRDGTMRTYLEHRDLPYLPTKAELASKL